MLFILLVILLLLSLGSLPTWPHSRNWGYYPSGGARLGCNCAAGTVASGESLKALAPA